ncbi:MAG: DUF29 domain-containing protein [Pseudanabaena sp.]|jgi:hypothetical protein|nr:DUF29 domain-containing protein [Pseudanabaena sp. M110S1SP2A07QC]MCA6531726.1 DUF29 domain-containing protein [Pseudanabaena sp. M125S2SP2A07QC]MCA6534963.1 DUF29 domain-containing protein [Pseudanabaena sp. M176S2SP2A07QC]MCA6540237.1 DUF29 domain-containing protein [Pseudanabaena sp. M037S2SP2A07QC]MCA6545401.1 DUF29 domain-containing protein [Pseudanabaena sp. M074S1SP2A07QC]MCA6549017.1 DUF29 domain-containing protein [Pseudanabaena sp. M152S2SP2A07QC]MCA6554662.1 DUF29 domain-contain
MTELLTPQSLYDQDILLWVEDTVAKLKAHDFTNLDLENLIEEVESLGVSQKKELLNRLITLLEHLLKRIYVPLPNDYNGWERTIRNQRKKLEALLVEVPSLKTRWNISFSSAWNIALKTVRAEYSKVEFPDSWQFSSDLEPMLSDRFWQEVE